MYVCQYEIRYLCDVVICPLSPVGEGGYLSLGWGVTQFCLGLGSSKWDWCTRCLGLGYTPASD